MEELLAGTPPQEEVQKGPGMMEQPGAQEHFAGGHGEKVCCQQLSPRALAY